MDMDGMSNNGTDGMDMGMQMYFHAGFKEYVLFEKALTTTQGEFAGACIVVVVWAVLYELLRQLREELHHRQTSNRQAILLHGSPEQKAAINSPIRQMLSQWHLLQTLLHVVQIFMSYCLMLVFMTYNVYLVVCLLIGTGLGYLAIGWRRPAGALSSSTENEHCH